MTRNKIIHYVWPPLLLYLAYLFSKLIWFDSLSSLANDSVHYIVMARHYSPWFSESKAIASAWLIQDFPPFFPWVLALSGAAHSLLFAHILVAGLGIFSLYFYYLLSQRWLENRAWAIFPVIIFTLSPGFILSLQGILSESLYLLLTFIFICLYVPENKMSRSRILITSILLAAVLLTRTIGIALVFAISSQAFFSSISQKKIYFQAFIVAALSLSIYFISMQFWGPVNESHYLDTLIPYLTGNSLTATGTGKEYYFSLAAQLTSMMNSWASFWILFWTEEISGIYITIMLLLLSSLTGLAIRLYKNMYDAWYVLFLILILVVWPHPGQMFRLLLPVIPFLLIYAGYAIIKLLNINKTHFNNNLIFVFFFLSVLAAILPSHMFILARVEMASEKNMVPVYEIFRRANPNIAEKELLLQNQMLNDFTYLSNSVPPNEKVMYFLPSYLAVLSDRIGIIAPSPVDKDTYRKIAKNNGVSSIFLTRLHPRNTSLSYSGLRGIEQLEGWTKLDWCSQLQDGVIASCLYSVENKVD